MVFRRGEGPARGFGAGKRTIEGGGGGGGGRRGRPRRSAKEGGLAKPDAAEEERVEFIVTEMVSRRMRRIWGMRLCFCRGFSSE